MQSGQESGNVYRFNAQLGYQQFFGKRKRFGLRCYSSFSYQYGKLAKSASAL
ncbi:outer membrane beta-barrel protein [Helicobacter heilmannii]|uniref:Uncharacterized protein n=1 Tax=Helicobacter heilmannii TaxID=35817 RepID=A0A0K2XZU6_HELHE|nr:outer membrane beta-barrel protein [Helicobacter heilmannii]CCM12127.1 hypothetical protein BN341_5140 [Helicobacter heilmannii ASB1.4]CRF45715.1 hypothetical protein HHE014_06860 [Helicobacter heilmannii]CRF47333.1 hypothetical protein HHE02_06210 [Helicobacter heilmannii]CRF48704.1 hypothetical protein HHE03_02780 [Helicobacter heilmannii]CRF51602.1 hypothetical protein HHE06_14900 [Helicobacter heilmannii]